MEAEGQLRRVTLLDDDLHGASQILDAKWQREQLDVADGGLRVLEPSQIGLELLENRASLPNPSRKQLEVLFESRASLRICSSIRQRVEVGDLKIRNDTSPRARPASEFGDQI